MLKIATHKRPKKKKEKRISSSDDDDVPFVGLLGAGSDFNDPRAYERDPYGYGYNTYGNQSPGQSFTNAAGNNTWVPKQNNPLADFDSANFDVEDTEQVRNLQQQMGITDDGVFGPETQGAYREYINQARVGQGKDAYSYADQPGVTYPQNNMGGQQKQGWTPFQNREQGKGLFGKDKGFLSGEGRMSEDRKWRPFESGFASGQGALSQWSPFQAGKERRMDRRYGSGESVVPQSTLDELDDAEFGVTEAFPSTDYGSGVSTPKWQFGQNMNQRREDRYNDPTGVSTPKWRPGQNIQQGRGIFGKEGGFGSGEGRMSQWFNRNKGTEDLNNEVNNIVNGTDLSASAYTKSPLWGKDFELNVPEDQNINAEIAQDFSGTPIPNDELTTTSGQVSNLNTTGGFAPAESLSTITNIENPREDLSNVSYEKMDPYNLESTDDKNEYMDLSMWQQMNPGKEWTGDKPTWSTETNSYQIINPNPQQNNQNSLFGMNGGY